MAKRRDENAPYWQQLRTAERGIIEFALEHGQTIRGTALILGVSPNFLSERVRELGIPAPEVRPGPKPGTKRPRPQLRVVSDGADAAGPPADTLDEDAPDAPEDQAEEGEKWYEDAEENEDEDGDEDFDGDSNDEDSEDSEDGEDASPQGN